MKRSFVKNSSIEQEINAIFNGISSNLKKGLVAEKARPSKGATFCKGMVNIYNENDFKKMEDNPKIKVRPLVSYAFYNDTYRPNRIGSVAIYGEEAFKDFLSHSKNGFLFGRRILKAKVEKGKYMFLDVKLVA